MPSLLGILESKAILNIKIFQVVPCHGCHIYGTWGSGEVEGSLKSSNEVGQFTEGGTVFHEGKLIPLDIM